MNALIPYLVPIVLLACGCASAGERPGKTTAADTFVLKETLVKGTDTGMTRLGGFRKNDINDVLCQHWQLNEAESILQAWDENNNRIFPELILFKDHTVTQNPRLQILMGTWKVTAVNRKPLLILEYPGKKILTYEIKEIKSGKLRLAGFETQDEADNLSLISDALNHQNPYNDPFHPVNNQWRLPPAKPENDSLVKERVKQCIKFYALYFRDNIKRQKTTISFTGLPEIFEWYRRGIGLPDKDAVTVSWTGCFYNKEQALKGYDLLRELIVNYEFNWPKKAPTWLYETHSVLEQMYHKL